MLSPIALAQEKPAPSVTTKPRPEFHWINLTTLKGFAQEGSPLMITADNQTVYGQYKGPLYKNPLTKSESVWHYFKWTKGFGVKEIPPAQLPPGLVATDEFGHLEKKKRVAKPDLSKVNLPNGSKTIRAVDTTPDGKTWILALGDEGDGANGKYAYWNAESGATVDVYEYLMKTLGFEKQVPKIEVFRRLVISGDGAAIAGEGYREGKPGGGC